MPELIYPEGMDALDFIPVSRALDLVAPATGARLQALSDRITVVGLPEDWRIFIDSAVARQERVVIGSGLKISKLLVCTDLLKNLPGVDVIEGLAS